ncbi:sensor histidine kinase [Nocardia tengchongensis]|uniref:histidine kinase n=1 Tax=Nocardia tengchongensis TaxID=2055889 RepID=A0ABX8CVS8_9NOCA|nr:sensor histidine kinase [Nocardia tengchongensis]QVI24007.1 sensor histidine kinase [Nocardia tengchongensis]
MPVTPHPPLITRLPPGFWLVLDTVFGALVALWSIVELREVSRDPDPLGRGLPHPGPAALALAVGTIIALGVVIALRRRAPLGGSLALLATWVVFVAVDGRYWFAVVVCTTTIVAATMVVYLLASTRGTWIGLKALGVAVAAGALTLVGHADLRQGGSLAAIATASAWAIGYTVARHRAYRTDLARHERRLVHAEFVEQRLEIARELHDVIAHSMSVVSIQSGYGLYVLDRDPAQARSALDAIQATSQTSIRELRNLLAVLRAGSGDGGPDGLVPTPRLADLDTVIGRTEDAGVQVDLRITGTARPLTAGMEVNVYRIIQEALTNVVKHADATTARVRVDYGANELAVEIHDDGCGGPAAPDGHGLSGMRERVAIYGGRFSAGAGPDTGFLVSACLPMGGLG